MSGTTLARRLARLHSQPRPRSRARYFSGLHVLAALLLAWVIYASPDSSRPQGYPDLTQSIAGVSCTSAHTMAIVFGNAVADTKKSPPDYRTIGLFGFKGPVNPADIEPLRRTLEDRLGQLRAKADAAVKGDCADSPTASILDADGKSKVLPLVGGSQPLTPLSGSESNRDSRTVPVTIGTDDDSKRTNTWSELDSSYGSMTWYTECAATHLGVSWRQDVPKYTATEGEHDNRFILAVNTSLTDDQIRKQAAADGNPNVESLPVIRTESIINTRNLKDNRCDEFIDTRSMVRVSLGKIVFDEQGEFKALKTDEGVFVDCHNLWRLPKSLPTPTPHPSSTPTPKTSTTTPAPPTTKPPKCVPPEVPNNNGMCVVPKDPRQGAGSQGNVPPQVQGTNPPAGSTAEPRPANPPATYVPPPPPTSDGGTTQPTPTRTTVPPREEPAPRPTDPATGCVPPPGMTLC